MTPDELRSHIIQCSNDFASAIESGDKDYIRKLHIESKKSLLDPKKKSQLYKDFKKYSHFFIEPELINISKIDPILINVEDGKNWAEIFTLVRHTWSMSYNKGYGRRLRYVVYDQYHKSVIGIIGFQSPPVDLAGRDNLFSYPSDKKMELINQTLDIYSLGSVPPYSALLGGKLVAGLAASKKIVRDYQEKYADQLTLIDGKKLNSQLVALTTTSAFGRSSIYNRLKFKDRLIAESIGYTKGFGTVHIDTLYEEIKQLLIEKDQYHKGGYGNGPKQKWQNISKALGILNLPNTYAKHGMKREIFLYRLVKNLEIGMSGGDFGDSMAIDEKEFSQYWISRWAMPRAERFNSWKDLVTRNYMLEKLELNNYE